MTLDQDTITAIADAVAERLRIPTGWPTDRPLLREPELAGLMGIGHEKLVDLRRSGAITHRRVGRTVLYCHTDLSIYLDGCRRNGEGGNHA